MNKYPYFVTWWVGEKYKVNCSKMQSVCKQKGIPFICEALPISDIEQKCPSIIKTKKHLSEKRYIFRIGLLWIIDFFLTEQTPIFYVHSDNKILRKPEPSVFENTEVGYCYGINKQNKNLITLLSHGLFFRPGSISSEFVHLLKTKLCLIKSELPSEHGIIENTLMDFITCTHNLDYISKKFHSHYRYEHMARQTTNPQGKWRYREHIRPLHGKQRKYVISGLTKDTYIQHV